MLKFFNINLTAKLLLGVYVILRGVGRGSNEAQPLRSQLFAYIYLSNC